MADRAVVIAGGGPTGLMLAGELALAGIDVEIIERRESGNLDGSRSRGLHARTIEVLDQRGIADRFLAEGQPAQVQAFGGTPLDISDFPTRHNYGLALMQVHVERILSTWVDELGVPIARGREVVDLAQDEAGVHIGLSDGGTRRAQYLVGCDGGRSVVRKASGIDFLGWDPSQSWLIAEVEMDEQPEFGVRPGGGGGIGPTGEEGRVGVVVTEPCLDQSAEPTLNDLREALVEVYGTDYGLRRLFWISRFTDMARQAASYREGRVLLVGDAAHVHAPQGGQGLNIGVQDAVNLGWKLGQVVNGTSGPELLDTYQTERHPIAARVLRDTMAQVALIGTSDRTEALRENVAELLAMDEPRKRVAGRLSGLDVHYDLGDGHPLLGRRIPDLDLVTADGAVRLFTLLHSARPLLVNLAAPGTMDVTGWEGRVALVDATYSGAWELPVIGAVAAPTAILVRPDGYVAWVGEEGHAGPVEAMTRWFGSTTSSGPARSR